MNRFLLLVIINLFSFTTIISQESDLRNEIEKIIRYDTEIDYKKTPGFIVTVIDNDNTFHFSFGSKTKQNKEEISAYDIFEIGSVTKVFTSRIIDILVNENVIKVDDTVNSFLPLEWQNPRLNNLTIYDLVHHSSGLPKRPSYFGKKEKDSRNPYGNYSQQDLLKFYSNYIPDDEKSFVYSHTNYALLEIIIENVTGKSFQDVLLEKILQPMNMNNSFVDFPEKRENLISIGYDRSKKVTIPWTFKSFKGSEGIKSTADDMAKFVKYTLRHNSAIDTNDVEGFNKNLGVKMGWHTIHMNDFDIWTHTGKTSGHNSFVGLVKETKTAVIILSNSSIGTEDLGLQILRMINYNWKRIKV
jgi:CubicO group peptidase (beta-lactamase class C family)